MGFVLYWILTNGLILQEMLVYISVAAHRPASKDFTLPISFSRHFMVFACGQATQANACARVNGFDVVNVGVHWAYHQPGNCGIYVLAVGF